MRAQHIERKKSEQPSKVSLKKKKKQSVLIRINIWKWTWFNMYLSLKTWCFVVAITSWSMCDSFSLAYTLCLSLSTSQTHDIRVFLSLIYCTYNTCYSLSPPCRAVLVWIYPFSHFCSHFNIRAHQIESLRAHTKSYTPTTTMHRIFWSQIVLITWLTYRLIDLHSPMVMDEPQSESMTTMT